MQYIIYLDIYFYIRFPVSVLVIQLMTAYINHNILFVMKLTLHFNSMLEFVVFFLHSYVYKIPSPISNGFVRFLTHQC